MLLRGQLHYLAQMTGCYPLAQLSPILRDFLSKTYHQHILHQCQSPNYIFLLNIGYYFFSLALFIGQLNDTFHLIYCSERYMLGTTQMPLYTVHHQNFVLPSSDDTRPVLTIQKALLGFKHGICCSIERSFHQLRHSVLNPSVDGLFLDGTKRSKTEDGFVSFMS